MTQLGLQNISLCPHPPGLSLNSSLLLSGAPGILSFLPHLLPGCQAQLGRKGRTKSSLVLRGKHVYLILGLGCLPPPPTAIINLLRKPPSLPSLFPRKNELSLLFTGLHQAQTKD